MADTLDVITLAEAREATNITSGQTAELERMITAISRRMDELCGPIVERTVTEYHDGGETWVQPRQTPVSSIGTVTEADSSTTTVLTAESFGTVPADAYLLADNDAYVHDAIIIRRELGADARFPGGGNRRNVKVEYTAGRYDTTANVDARFKQAAQAILSRMWDREAGAWSRADDPFDATGQLTSRFFNAVDHMIKELLADERRLPGIR